MSDSPSTPRRRSPPPGDGSRPQTGSNRPVGRPGNSRSTTQSVPRRAPGRPRQTAAARDGGPRLTCSAGPRAGEEFELESAEAWVIGRSTDVSISIPDTSVSRRHSSIHLKDGRWMVEDLGSGNGTLVNGAAISAETPLAHGDVLNLGDTELTFLAGSVTPDSTARRPNPLAEGGGAALVPVRRAAGRPEARRPRGRQGPDPEEQKAKRKKILLIAGGVLAVALIPLSAIKYVQMKDAERAAQDQAAVQAERARFGQLAQEGKSLLRDRKWEEAATRFKELLVLAPDHQEAKDYLAVIGRESQNQALLDEARKGIKEGKIAASNTALQGLKNTLMHEDERKLKTALGEAVVSRVREARTIMANPDRTQWPTAKAMLEDILAAFPEDRDARIALDDLDEALGTPDPNAPKAPKPRAKPKPSDAGLAAYMRGDIGSATASLEACSAKAPECRDLLDKVRRFSSLNERVDSLDAAGLGRLLQLDREITDGEQSPMARDAGLRAANAYYRSASAAMAASQWSRASQYVQRALRANAQHEGSKRLSTQLREKAQGVFMEGYIIKESSPEQAREKMRQVMEMSPAGDETHQKAKRLLTTLGG